MTNKEDIIPVGSIVLANPWSSRGKAKRYKITAYRNGYHEAVACSKKGIEYSRDTRLHISDITKVEYRNDPIANFTLVGKNIKPVGIKRKKTIEAEIRRVEGRIRTAERRVWYYQDQITRDRHHLSELFSKKAQGEE